MDESRRNVLKTLTAGAFGFLAPPAVKYGQELVRNGTAQGVGVLAEVVEGLKPRLAGVGVFRYPPGFTEDVDGKPVRNAEIAKEIASQIEPGGIVVLPSGTDDYGNYLWDFRVEGGDPSQVAVARGCDPGNLVLEEGVVRTSVGKVPRNFFYTNRPPFGWEAAVDESYETYWREKGTGRKLYFAKE